MPATITRDLLRKRSEHNDGELETLEEITLHQFDIEKIELIQESCRQLRILYLQSNQIQRIENLGKLKRLEYLNLALNNIKRIENLEGCESLRKLDLTVNFVEDLLSLETLKGNELLRELYLVGNPCATTEGYRSFVIATLPQLETLDGQQITRSERIVAHQEYARIRERLVLQAEGRNEQTPEVQTVPDRSKPFDLNEPVPHTPEARLLTARELAAKRAQGRPEDQPRPEPKPVETPPVAFHDDGRIIQRNLGKLDFNLIESETEVVLRVKLSPFVDTSLLDLQVESDWLRLVMKGRPLDLALPYPVDKDRSEAVRGQATGVLEVRMPRLGAVQKKMEKTVTGYVAGKTKKPSLENDTPRVDYRHIVQSEEKENSQPKIKFSRVSEPTAEALARQKEAMVEFTDDPDVPPLE